MRILHTADWHLGDRMGRIDRTDDLRRAVERVAEYCTQKKVDVLLVAGDIFSEMSRPDSLRESIEHLQTTFERFLLEGGTILAITGNHDNENFCQTLRLVMNLAAPASAEIGESCSPGRLYLAANPTFLRLTDRTSQSVQFLLMPYPTPTRYLREVQTQRYGSLDEKNRFLQSAYATRLREFLEHPAFDADQPTVLSAHVHVQGAQLPNLFRISEQESIIFAETDLPTHLAYIALGHIHQPHCLLSQEHVRYSGSIERLDLGERLDEKSVALFEVGPQGLLAPPELLPLPATPMYDLEIWSPKDELPTLRTRYPDSDKALVRYHLHYKAGEDNLHEMLGELDRLFPRWYQRSWVESGELGPALSTSSAGGHKSFHDTVLDYVKSELVNHSDDEQAGVMRLIDELLAEDPS